ncbi:MAG: SDR family oxidoreductase [Deinococcota bacterium]
MNILVTGATGYIGGRLLPRLLEHTPKTTHVRTLVRDKTRFLAVGESGKTWVHDVDVAQADVLSNDNLEAPLTNIDVAYYLIHSMGASAKGFEDRDKQAAANFANAAKRAGVKHIIYLGGLGDASRGISSHLESRQETGRVLASTGIPVTEFRAAIIVGSGSLSFEMIRYLTERLPVMVTPKWVNTRIQPIAVRDVLSYLLQAPEHRPDGHAIIEIGGPEVLTYREMMLGYAKARGLTRRMFGTKVLSPQLSSYWVNIVTPIPAAIARPLIQGLGSEVIVHHPEPAGAFTVENLSYQRAVELALKRNAQGAVETLWSGSLAAVPRGTPAAQKLEQQRLQDTQGMLIDKRIRQFKIPPEYLFKAVVRIGGDEGWYSFNWLWQIRGLLDRLIGGVGMRRGRRDPNSLLPGDALDFWRVEDVEEGSFLQLHAEMKVPGQAWLRFDVQPAANGSEVTQTAFFEPKGLLGVLYWWAIYPLHLLVFPSMIRAIGKRAEDYHKSAVVQQ